jgi:Putative prokaryotic signal transducing protein
VRPRRLIDASGRPLNFTVRCTVALVRLVSPDSDPEIIAIVAMLEAHGIPCYVRGGGFGGLFPGVQINAYNTRDIMIPEEQAAPALELLKDFQSRQPDPEPNVKPRKSGRLRNLFELLLFGWFVPTPAARMEKRDASADGTPNNRWRGP